MTSALFVRDVATVEYTWVKPDGTLSGGSLSFDLEVKSKGGNGMCFSFKTVCQAAVHFLNHPSLGFNSKIWFIAGLSGGYVGRLQIVTPSTDIRVPSMDVIRVMEHSDDAQTAFKRDYQALLERELQNLVGDDTLELTVVVNSIPTRRQPNSMGLGILRCQGESVCNTVRSVVEGTRGFIEWTHTESFRADCVSCQTALQEVLAVFRSLDDAIWVRKSDIIQRAGDNLTIRINTIYGPGQLQVQLDKYLVMAIESNPDVSTIATTIANTLHTMLTRAHIATLTVGERPNRGARVIMKEPQ